MNKTELLQLVKELVEVEDLSSRQSDLFLLKKEQRKFNPREEDSFLDNEQNEEFAKYFAELSKKAADLNINVADEKRKVIEEVKAQAKANNFKKATEEVKTLTIKFKSLGRCSKEEDDALWADFKAALDEFYGAKKEYFAQVEAKINDAKTKKEALVEEAKKVLEMENFKAANEKLNAIMEEWKKAGYAGKTNDELWAAFSEARKAFYDKRKQYFASLDSVFAERVEKKQEVIKKARILLARSEFTAEEVAEMDALRKEYKAIGFAGKENDDNLWKEFSTIVRKYDSLKEE